MQPVVRHPHQSRQDSLPRVPAWIGMIGLGMTAIYVFGIMLRMPRRYLGLGADSWAALLFYGLGIWGFLVVSG